MEDSTRLRHQTRINVDAPFYFGSLRKNYYERDVYTLAASAQRSFMRDRLPVTLGVNYRVGNHFSNNDPRGRVQDFQFDTFLAAGLVFRDWTAHLKGRYGYGRETVNIGFKNDKYIQNTVDSLYVNWLMNGYGNAFEQIREMEYKSDMGRYGIGVHLSRRVNHKHAFFANATYVGETQHFKQDRVTPLTYEELNRYKRNNGEVELLWSSKLGDFNSALYMLSFGAVQGKDYNFSINKNNYVFYRQTARARAIWSVQEYQFALDAVYNNTSSEDGLTGNLLEYTHLTPMVSVKVGLPLSPSYMLYPGVRLGYNAVLQKHINLPETNSGIFTKTIIYHDYLYYSTPSLLASMSADIVIGRQRSKQWKVGLNLDYTRRRALSSHTFHPPTMPGRSRLASSLNVSMYF